MFLFALNVILSASSMGKNLYLYGKTFNLLYINVCYFMQCVVCMYVYIYIYIIFLSHFSASAVLIFKLWHEVYSVLFAHKVYMFVEGRGSNIEVC